MKIKAMTYNLPCWGSSNPNYFFGDRKERIKDFLLREMPDIIGFQEMQDSVKTWLSDNMPDYIFLGMGREINYNGESVTIAYNKRKFDLFKFDQFWLSPTPTVPGSRFNLDQSEFPRISVQATLVSKETHQPFTFANTHLDHIGEIARVCGADLILSKLTAANTPFILTGDFNEYPNGSAIKEITAVKGVYDLTAGIKENTFRYPGGDGKLVDENGDPVLTKIDYIFSNGSAVEGTLTLHNDPKDGILSDHYPVSVVVEL
ncbi:MAG: endonuclease/exonuclease/phosphatase family protein [Clostridia bacterium]|nr:endonuclease/exonuclease/phosphatase family protein [Clostridia bacterium]